MERRSNNDNKTRTNIHNLRHKLFPEKKEKKKRREEVTNLLMAHEASPKLNAQHFCDATVTRWVDLPKLD